MSPPTTSEELLTLVRKSGLVEEERLEPYLSLASNGASAPRALAERARQLHQAGNEAAWWEKLRIDALEVARGLWKQSRPAAVAKAVISPEEQTHRRV